MASSLVRSPRTFAVIGAGIAGLACARTQSGHAVTLFERSEGPGGRMASVDTPFGTFDHGAQYFTVRDARFRQVLDLTPTLYRPWSANAVRVLDPHGRQAEAALPRREPHWVASPAMGALARHWAEPLRAEGRLVLNTRVVRIARDAVDPARWQLHTAGPDDAVQVFSGFDGVVLAIPSPQSCALLQLSGVGSSFVERIGKVDVAPCWTLMVAFPQAAQPGLPHLGPQWNAALSTHHRIAWLARESSKPGRGPIERWTVQASPAWSTEHLEDDAQRVQGKLLKAFSEITGIRAQPAYAQAYRWRHAKTGTPLGSPYLWDEQAGIGVCGDWCLGHRVEDAFLSGLELALAAL